MHDTRTIKSSPKTRSNDLGRSPSTKETCFIKPYPGRVPNTTIQLWTTFEEAKSRLGPTVRPASLRTQVISTSQGPYTMHQ